MYFDFRFDDRQGEISRQCSFSGKGVLKVEVESGDKVGEERYKGDVDELFDEDEDLIFLRLLSLVAALRRRRRQFE